MSWEANRWAWRTPGAGLAKYVLLALADYADAKDATCYPSLGDLSAKTGLGTSTVRRLLRQLEADGLIKVDVTTGGRHARSTYTLLVGTTPRGRVDTQPQRAGFEGRETQPQRVGKSGETQPKRAGKDLATQPQRAGSEAGNPPAAARNPTRAGDVVLRTKTSHQPEDRDGAAAASPDEQPGDDGRLALLPPLPAARSVNAGNIASAWIDAYRREHPGVVESTRQKLQAARESRALLDAGNDPGRVLAAAESAAAKGYPTVEREFTLLSARRNGVRPAAGQLRPSTTDIRVAQTLALAHDPEEPA